MKHMERSSEFVKNKALFGSFPLQEQVDLFESIGVRYFVDLTREGESKIIPYKTKYNYINYPIHDRRVPTDWRSFATFIIKIGDIIKSLKNSEKIYLHCKGGHGRSGVVVASLLCYLYKLSPPEALSKTSKYHNRRIEMREKWRKMGSPQTRSQKHFVTKFFEPLIVFDNHTTYFSTDFNNDVIFPIHIESLGTFQTVTAAFYAFKNPSDKNYIKRLEKLCDRNDIIKLSDKCVSDDNFDKMKEDIMYTVLFLKFEQHENVRKNLLDTGLRPVIVRSPDNFWGKSESTGRNILGKMLVSIREYLYKKI